ncbi:MAG: hypothetical protein AAF745_11665, partial [Planctomycetota bacterium]
FSQPHVRDVWQSRFGIEELRGPQFVAASREWFLNTAKSFGFNSLGVHNARHITNHPKPSLPYIQPITFVSIAHWTKDVPDEAFLDVFGKEFADHCDHLAQTIASPIRNDPYLIGYAMTDCPLLTDEDSRERVDVIGGERRPSRTTWPRRLRNQAASTSGKQAYVALMRDLYHNEITAFNKTYRTDFDSFDALASANNWRLASDRSNGNESRDNIEFLKRIVDRYYSVTRDSIRRYDTNHLFLGDKLNGNTDSLDTVLPITAKYTDIIFYQMYGKYADQKPGLDRWSKVADLPIINGDSSFTMITDTMPRPFGPVADDERQRADWTAEFFRRAFARSEFVGWHYCGLVDLTNNMPNKRGRQHSGLIRETGEPYATTMKTLRHCADEMYQIASVNS